MQWGVVFMSTLPQFIYERRLLQIWGPGQTAFTP